MSYTLKDIRDEEGYLKVSNNGNDDTNADNDFKLKMRKGNDDIYNDNDRVMIMVMANVER